MQQIADRLRGRGVTLLGNESSEELGTLLEAVERFETATVSRGGDLMVDQPPRGSTPQPDDVHFVLPRRNEDESVARYVARLDAATRTVHHHLPLDRLEARHPPPLRESREAD
jgi:hypothetical protein